MSGQITELLSIATMIGSGVVGGVFFAFSTFVMSALARLPEDVDVLEPHSDDGGHLRHGIADRGPLLKNGDSTRSTAVPPANGCVATLRIS